MLRTVLFSFVGIFLFSNFALAGPEGTYSVVGTDPGSGNTYSGEVTVSRTGDTYSVVWIVDGTKYIGTGLGAATINGSATMGRASDADTAIAVSYIAESSFGLTFYVEQSNGQWKGIWTYGGSEKIGTEIWTPH